jgi:hypothetical protein
LYHSQQQYRFSLRHNLTTSQWTSLLTTYAAGPRDEYTLTYLAESPAATYTVKFTEPPMITGNHGGSRHDVRVELRGYKD